MKPQGLQELVKKVFRDEKIKIQFASNPESVISQYTLTEQEKKAVFTIHAKLGLANTNSTQLAAEIDPATTWFSPVP